MKKTNKWKCLVAMVLTMVLVSVSAVSAFAYSAKYDINQDGKVVYTVLGDSISAGCDLPYYDGYADRSHANWPLTPGSFPEYVGKGVNADVINQDAKTGFRTTDLRCFLDDNYSGDKMVSWAINGNAKKFTPAQLAQLREEYQNDVRNADIITLEIGANDWGMQAYFYKDTLEDYANTFYRQVSAVLQPFQYADITMQNAEQVVWDTEMLYEIPASYYGFYDTFKTNFDAIITRIHKLNPKAQIYVIGQYYGMSLFRGSFIPEDMDILMSPYVQLYNSYMSSGCPHRAYYTYVEPKHVETVNPLFFNFHPNLRGQKQLANQVIKSIQANN